MIIELLLFPLFKFAEFLISLIPDFFGNFGATSQLFIDFISKGLYFFGKTPFMLVIGSITFWFGVSAIWSTIEWIYKKIPGVN